MVEHYDFKALNCISLFREENHYLSNFEAVEVIYEGVAYPSVEHAYMSAKSLDPIWKKVCADRSKRPGDVKKLGRKVKLRLDWENIKIDVMTECVRYKFSKEPLRSKLMKTGDKVLIEGNWWKDCFWGVDINTGIGENNLGKILMKIRTELHESVRKP